MNIKQLLMSWHLWIVVLVVSGFLLFQKSFDASILPFLALVLICPIVMMFMMGGKNHKH